MSSGKRRSVEEKEMKSECLMVRIRPSTKRRLEEMSDAVGCTMSALVEHAILGLEVEELGAGASE